jgi:hypothetical protein
MRDGTLGKGEHLRFEYSILGLEQLGTLLQHHHICMCACMLYRDIWQSLLQYSAVS